MLPTDSSTKIPCNKCKRVLPFPAMFVSAMRKREGCRVYFKVCRICHQQLSRAWVLRNKERAKEYRRKYYQSHKKEFLEYKRAERRRNKERK